MAGIAIAIILGGGSQNLITMVISLPPSLISFLWNPQNLAPLSGMTHSLS
jgi:hypothetical protein